MPLVRGEAAPLRESADQPPRSSPVHSAQLHATAVVAVARGIVRGRGQQLPAAPPSHAPTEQPTQPHFFLLLLGLRERPVLGTLPAHIAAAFIHAHMRPHSKEAQIRTLLCLILLPVRLCVWTAYCIDSTDRAIHTICSAHARPNLQASCLAVTSLHGESRPTCSENHSRRHHRNYAFDPRML